MRITIHWPAWLRCNAESADTMCGPHTCQRFRLHFGAHRCGEGFRWDYDARAAVKATGGEERKP